MTSHAQPAPGARADSAVAPVAGLRVSLGTKLLYGVGAAASAIKSRVLSTFLLIFYNQVMGLPPQTVGAAIMIATIFDAVIDPVVGHVSDNFRSRWGRRHPFMYASALPTCAGFFLLWNPPAGLSPDHLFAYMLACLLLVRLFDTFFEVPASALAPELARDYDERTTLFAIRTGFALAGGLAMILAAYQIFMPEDAAGQGGVTEREGYFGYSLTCSLVILAAIFAASAGTHHLIPHLERAPPRSGRGGGGLRGLAATLGTHAFVVMCLAGMLYSIAMGVRQALEIYFYLYFWGFDQAQISVLTIASIPGSLAGVALAPLMSRRLGKKAAAILCLSVAMAATLAPPILRVCSLLPANDHPLVFNLLLVETVVTQVLLVAAAVCTSSMLADIVEDTAVRTGRRAEGLLLSADNLFKKIVSGVGIFMSGLVLSAVGFPDDARRAGVSEAVLRDFAIAYIPAFAGFFLLGILLVALFRIDRARHEENLEALALAALAREAAADVGEGASADLPPAADFRARPAHGG